MDYLTRFRLNSPNGPLATYRNSEVQFTGWAAPGSGISYGFFLLFLLLLFTNAALLFPAIAALQPALLVAISGLTFLFIEKSLSRQSFSFVWPESHLLFAFLAVAGLSCFSALYMREAVERHLDLTRFVAIYFLMINTIDSQRKLRFAVWVMVIGGLFPALGTAQNYLNGVLVDSRASWVGIFENPNDLAQSLVLLLPLATSMAGDLRRGLRPLVWGIVAAYMTAIYLSFSRGGIAGLLVVLVLLGLRQSGRSGRILMAILVLASLLLVSLYWPRTEGFSGITQDLTFRQRLATIRAGLAMLEDYPLIGVGLGCSAIGWPLYAVPDLYFRGWLHTHNTAIQVLSETGIIGFVIYALLVAAALRDSRRIAKAYTESGNLWMARLLTGLEISIWGFLVCGLSGGFALSWLPYLLIGLVCSAKRIALSPAEGPRSKRV